MKTFSVLHILLFILLMIVYQCSKAQEFVVLTKGDTLRGEVKALTFGPDKKVTLVGTDKKRNTFSILQVRSYNDNGEIFVPAKGPNGFTFMKVIKPGYLTLLGFQQENQTGYDGLFLQKKDGTGIEVPNLSFKKTIKNFLEDCPDVSAKISNGELGKRDIKLIVDEYNSCIQNKTDAYAKDRLKSEETSKKISSWDVLEESVKAKEFESKKDALEMIADIKNKIKQNEKIPNFLLEGLKNSLANAEVSAELQNALNDVKQ